ncbi:MAG: T9SS type A sorting domain-containing protein, partial [Cyclobacteriaceae bacterium]|nr:T9SS type A sorting domain-containing protein [Cyclobacteriaceae bacterium]
SQPGDASYHAATSVSQTLTVNKIDQNITFAAIPDKTVGDPAFALTASTTSSLPVSFSTVSNKITINGAQVSIVSAGRVTVTATQTGNANYNAATPVERSFCIKPAQPTITLSNLNSEAPTLTSSASTGNQWYRNDVVITGATNTVFTATEEGMYKVRSVVDDCVSDFSDEVILVVTSLEENGNQISLFPNPTEDWLTVSLNELNGNKQISIVNTQGNVKESKEVEGSEATFNVAAYARGVYFVKVKMKNSVRVLRFVKQ